MGRDTILLALIASDAICLLFFSLFLVLNEREMPPGQREGAFKPMLGIGLLFLFGSGLFYAGIWLLWP